MILIRVDASTDIGSGHLMRCLALAQGWKNRAKKVIFVMATEASGLVNRLESEAIEVIKLSVELGSFEDAQQTADSAKKLGINWIVIDGYHFDSHYQKIIKSSGLKLFLIDDYGQTNDYCADFVLNQNISADESLYRNRNYNTQLLLGTQYVMLRQEFLTWQGWQRQVPKSGCKILVSLGGGDPDNVTEKVIKALQQLEQKTLEVIVIVGGTNPYYDRLKLAIQGFSCPIQIKKNISNMPELMAWADLAITAGGSTCWELAFLGLPSIVIILADNQQKIAEKLDQMGLIINLGWHETVSLESIKNTTKKLQYSQELREKMSRLGQQLIDGQGVTRILTKLDKNCLHLRPTNSEDCQLLWQWVNDPVVRKWAFSSNPISWENHCQWFALKLQDNNCYIFIALDKQDEPIGQIRFDVDENNYQADIDVSIAPEKRGLGYGSLLIKTGVKKIFTFPSVSSVHAYIKEDNKASIRAFEKAQFKLLGREKIQGYFTLHYWKVREHS
ncbi:UDP-2,4-diacetamido-2,4,6-trideoxy-beta-L-altropyranose hydrolase [Crocosphaera watsonii]|uniref:N-Acetylneuraminate cytidylyltransferase n=1 Tax=Crocosphaera watsonii WH 0401 TaxID=555881 RepID=T2J3X9_CROWT|nr:UDP-2,4-diacetamido-2,4,6-trideoxy-beta-L-altropyranose hydrolase [Crocosphaera watsonii]CCQ59836.1 N-Acetylneuraminate cytidylyltransferase [Crocosphaera watsonii WH 0401]